MFEKSSLPCGAGLQTLQCRHSWRHQSCCIESGRPRAGTGPEQNKTCRLESRHGSLDRPLTQIKKSTVTTPRCGSEFDLQTSD